MLILRDVTKSYGEVRAVNGLNLNIAAGETVALLGPNGAGKSTTIALLLGLIPPGSGTVEVFGGSPERAMRAGRVGAMLQEGGLIPRVTVRELLQFVRNTYPRPLPLDKVLAAARITELANRRVDKLSGGQAQRVRFAIALAGDPDLIVLDEPTAALDVESRQEFWAAMRDFEGTVLFCSHYLEEADENADRIVVIADGRVVADGTGRDIKRTVGGRTVSFRLGSAPSAGFDRLPGVSSIEIRGDRAFLRSNDSDATVLALAGLNAVKDLEVTGAGLEEAFLALTGGTRPTLTGSNSPKESV